VTVPGGDAFGLPRALPERLDGKAGTMVCGIPLVMLPLQPQSPLVAAAETVTPGVDFVLYTDCITSPLPYRDLGLTAKREAWTPCNFPLPVCGGIKLPSRAPRRNGQRADPQQVQF
jgi:phosphatidylethanolamine/phosphatidyl-N-methylethanolamine N-methyltransferase